MNSKINRPNVHSGWRNPLEKLRRSLLTCAVFILVTASAFAQSISPAVTNIWRLPAGVEPDFLAAADGLVRGAAINPVNGNVVYASRAAFGNHIAVVDAATGFVSNLLSSAGVSGGTLALVGVKVADDGVVYAANLAGATSTLKIYRWDSDATTDDPVNVFNFAGVTTRYGDAMDLRGSGVSTEIIISGSGGNKVALFTTTDGTNFNAALDEFGVLTNYMKEIPYPAGLSAGDLGKGIAFDGTNNAFYAKKDGTTPLRYLTYDPVALTATNGVSLAVDARLVGLDIGVTNGFKLAAGVLYGSGTALTPDQHRARFWDVTVTNAPQLIFDDPLQQPNPTYFANANAIGAADAQNGRIVVLEPNNGIALYQLYLVTNPPPAITAQPVGNTNVLTGGFYTLNVGASGSNLKYQWWLNNNPVALATNATLNLTNITDAEAGLYFIAITNSGGSAISSNAEVALLPSVLTPVAAKIWQLTPGSRSYLTSDNTQRGMAFNALSNHLLIVNRAVAPSINVLDAATGNNLTNLDLTGVGGQSGETFPINMVGVAEDGAIYACNLTTTGGGFTLYRWADENPTTQATIAYGPDFAASERIGDTFAVQGAGVNTRLLASTRNGTVVVVFTTVDGVTFTANTVDVATGPNPAPAGFAGLGLAAGGGDTFWGTSGTFLLRKVIYDLANGTNDVQLAQGGQTGNNIGVDTVNNFVADTGTGDTPSNLRILDVQDPTAGGVLVDQEFFGSDNDNINGTGAVAFDVPGGRLFALDSNNGLMALKYAPRLYSTASGSGTILTWTGPGTLQSASSPSGSFSDIVTTSPYTNTGASAAFFRVRR